MPSRPAGQHRIVLSVAPTAMSRHRLRHNGIPSASQQVLSGLAAVLPGRSVGDGYGRKGCRFRPAVTANATSPTRTGLWAANTHPRQIDADRTTAVRVEDRAPGSATEHTQRTGQTEKGRNQMKITVFGATGSIGGHIVQQALDAGHKVTAVVRDPARFDVERRPALEVVTVPGLTDPEVLCPVLEGSDTAISGVGPRGRKDGPVASSATRGILRAMEASGVRRFVAVSAAPVGPVPQDDSFVNRRIVLPFFGALLRDLYADLAEMEDEIRRSTTEWTVVRPPKLVNKPLTGKYRTVVGGNVPRGYSISRADTAHLMLAVLDNPATVKQVVGVAY
jgi:putative NADH-flavin reductase